MYYMEKALETAMQSGPDIPIGAVIVKRGEILSAFHNEKEVTKDVTAHAEILAIKDAQKKLGTYILEDCEMYVTLEPCPMCAWAILNARIPKIYFGAYDNLYGALGSSIDLKLLLKSKIEIKGGILEEQCSTLIKNYFKKIR